MSNILIDQFDRFVQSAGKASAVRQGNTVYYVCRGVIMSYGPYDGQDFEEGSVYPYRDDVPVYPIPPGVDFRPAAHVDPGFVPLSGLCGSMGISEEQFKNTVFTVGKFGKNPAAIHLLVETAERQYTQLAEHALADLGAGAMEVLGADIWEMPKVMDITLDEFSRLNPELHRSARESKANMVLSMTCENWHIYICLPRLSMAPGDTALKAAVEFNGKRYIPDVWDDKEDRFKKWKEGRMELARPNTKPSVAAPKAEPETKVEKEDVSKPAEKAEPTPIPVQQSPQPGVIEEEPEMITLPHGEVPAQEDRQQQVKPEPKKRTKPAVSKGMDYDALIAAISQVPEGLTAEQAKSALRSLRDLQIAISRAMTNLSLATIDTYESDATRYQELKKLIK